MEMELLALKVEVIEKTLAAFQKDVAHKLKVVEEVLATRTEQFAAQKFFMEKEELLHRSLWNSWNKCAVEKESMQSPEFQGTRRVIELPITSAHSASFKHRRGQSPGQGTRTISPRSHDLNPTLRHITNSESITVTAIEEDPLNPSTDTASNRQCRRGSTSAYSTNEYPSPLDKENDLEIVQMGFSNSADERSMNQTHTQNVMPENECPYGQDNVDNEEEEEVQVLDMKFTVTAKEGIEDPHFDSAAGDNNSTRVDVSPRLRPAPMHPNVEILLPSATSGQSFSTSTGGPTSVNVYSMLRNKYINKRSSANANTGYQNPPFPQSSQFNAYQHSSSRSQSSLHQRRHNFHPVHRPATTPVQAVLSQSVLRRGFHTCQDCSKAFDKASSLKKHREEEVCSKCFECSVCDASSPPQYFNEHSEIEAHMLFMHKLKRFRVCQFCRKCFGPFRGLLEHQLAQHGEQAAKEANKFKHRCMLCPKSYSTRNDLVCHSRSHTGERPFVCTDCKRTFADGRNLRKHQTICQRKLYSSYSADNGEEMVDCT